MKEDEFNNFISRYEYKKATIKNLKAITKEICDKSFSKVNLDMDFKNIQSIDNYYIDLADELYNKTVFRHIE